MIGHLWSPQSQNLASGYHRGLIGEKPLAGGQSYCSSARDRGPQKAGQGGVGLVLAPAVDERTRNEGG